jgi:putative RNA 2'-phosphotransferase
LRPGASELSRQVSRVLRHEPWLYELELDDEGFVSVDALLVAIRVAEPRWTGVDRLALEQMIAGSWKRRHEMVGDRVRALYGHSLPGRLRKERGCPPAVLFHGTSSAAAAAILVSGLQPMSRQFVHLSNEWDMAVQVGRRKAAEPVVLRIDAAAAQEDGVSFWVGNEAVWLAENVPARFIAVG